MLENHEIVCFGPGDWWGMNPSCATHIMSQLSTKNRVFYINPVSSDLSGIRGTRGLGVRLVRKLKSALKFFRRVHSNLFVVSPMFLPIQGNRLLDKVNNALVRTQIRLLLLLLNVKAPLLWIENIRAADFMSCFEWRFIVYHVSDRFEQCPYTRNKEKLLSREAAVAKNSDLIVCVSKQLYEQKKNSNSRVDYLPHGVHFDEFRQPFYSCEILKQLRNVKHPVAGYFGTLTSHNDIELLMDCARKLPYITFVLAGQITGGDYSSMRELANIILPGKVKYEQIPALCSIFDVCLLPWKMSEWIAQCNPLKLFEYMASGKPVVSVPINEVVQNYSDVVSVAAGKEQFSEAIKWELEYDNRERKEKRIDIACRHSWENQTDQLSDMILRGLSEKSSQII